MTPVNEVIPISYLSDLLPGEAACVDRVLPESPLARRLGELGLIRGTRIECVAAAPFGGPHAYQIRGAIIALRREDARTVAVQRMPAAQTDAVRTSDARTDATRTADVQTAYARTADPRWE